MKFIDENFLTRVSDIKAWLASVGIKNYDLQPNSVVNIRGTLFLKDIPIEKLPVKFGKVTGSVFMINLGLTTLEGFPYRVADNIVITHNKLTNLKGFIEEPAKNINLSYNELKSLEGCPSRIQGDLDISHNYLTDLEYAPTTSWQNFDCSNNRLTSLKGAPKWIGENFICNFNQLKNLAHAPENVEGYFECNFNPLESFQFKSQTPLLILHKSVLPNIEELAQLDMNLQLGTRHLKKFLTLTDFQLCEGVTSKKGSVLLHAHLLQTLMLNEKLQAQLAVSPTTLKKFKI